MVSTESFSHLNYPKCNTSFLGIVTASAAMHAYLADTTSESSRSDCYLIRFTSLADHILYGTGLAYFLSVRDSFSSA